ncbi:MAG TPA: YicC/YloC family endoribonuclease [Steroidobacteraceae bacterium]|nr:YicC/YloC family endoribonuclease [Steroidobacteraceae bacterium]
MTGFARRELAGPFGTLVCELRSVNHRFLDATLRLPDSCRSLESELRQAVAAVLKRGKIDCTISLRGADSGAASPQIDHAALDWLLERLRELSAAMTQHSSVDLIELLRFPGVLRQDGVDAEALGAAVRGLFTETLSDLAGARVREGERLAALIEQRCGLLAEMIAAVRAHLPETRGRVRQRFDERLAELGAQVDQGRIEQEILLLLQRSDIAEELDRLSGHLEETARTLKGGEPAGRRLDFLMQEFNREANTLSSKSQDLETTRAAVEMKVLIEQMREQVQNIE